MGGARSGPDSGRRGWRRGTMVCGRWRLWVTAEDKRCIRRNKDSSTRRSGGKSGNSGEVPRSEQVERVPGFLNRGCAIQEFWKSWEGWGGREPDFPRFPQGARNGLCKAGVLCEKRVPGPMDIGFARSLRFTEDRSLTASRRAGQTGEWRGRVPVPARSWGGGRRLRERSTEGTAKLG